MSEATRIRARLSPPLRAAWSGVVLIALILRLGWALSRPTDQATLESLPDQREYLELGRNVVVRDSLEFFDPRFGQTVYAFRMPGYPLLVAAFSGNVRVIRTVQAVIDTSTVLAAGMLATAIFDDVAAGLTAAVIVAVNPFLIYFCGLILSDTLFAALLAWALVLLQRRRWVGGSILLVLGAMVRPTGLGLALMLPGVTATVLNRSVVSAIRATVIVAVIAAAALVPWAVRNHTRLDAWVFTTTNAGFTLYDGFHDGATGASDQRFLSTMPALRMAGEVQRSRMLARTAERWIVEHPGKCVRLAGWKLLRFWSPVPLSADFGRETYVIVGGTFSVTVYALVVASACRARRWRPMASLATAAVYFSAVHACSVGSLRYRLPLEPALAVMASGGLRRTAGRNESLRNT